MAACKIRCRFWATLQVMTPHEKTRLMTYRASAAQYLNGRNAVHHYLLPVNAAADGGAPGFDVYVPAAAAATASSVSLGVVGSRRQPPPPSSSSSSSTSLLRRLHRMAASEGNDEPEPCVTQPPSASTTMPSLPARPRSMPPAARPVLERQLTATSTTTTVSGVGERRPMVNSRQPSVQSITGGSSTLDALGLRRSVNSSFTSQRV